MAWMKQFVVIGSPERKEGEEVHRGVEQKVIVAVPVEADALVAAEAAKNPIIDKCAAYYPDDKGYAKSITGVYFRSIVVNEDKVWVRI